MNYLKILPKFLNKASKPQEEKKGFTAFYDNFDITMTFKNNKTINKDDADKIIDLIISLQEHSNSFHTIIKT